MSSDTDPSAPAPPTKPHLEVTPDDVALSFRPWGPAIPADPSVPPPPPEDPLDPIFTDDALFTLVQALPPGATDTDDRKLRRKIAALHLLRSLDAQQPVEATLAAQAVLFHYHTMAALHRAARMPQPTDTSAGYDMAAAGRASTLYVRLLNALAKQQELSPVPRPASGRPRWRR